MCSRPPRGPALTAVWHMSTMSCFTSAGASDCATSGPLAMLRWAGGLASSSAVTVAGGRRQRGCIGGRAPVEGFLRMQVIGLGLGGPRRSHFGPVKSEGSLLCLWSGYGTQQAVEVRKQSMEGHRGALGVGRVNHAACCPNMQQGCTLPQESMAPCISDRRRAQAAGTEAEPRAPLLSLSILPHAAPRLPASHPRS